MRATFESGGFAAAIAAALGCAAFFFQERRIRRLRAELKGESTALSQQLEDLNGRLASALDCMERMSNEPSTGSDIRGAQQAIDRRMNVVMETSQQNFRIAQLEHQMLEAEIEILKEELSNVTALVKGMADIVILGGDDAGDAKADPVLETVDEAFESDGGPSCKLETSNAGHHLSV